MVRNKYMVRLAGLEPVTPTMSRWCSNQLSYSRMNAAHNRRFLTGRQEIFYKAGAGDKILTKTSSERRERFFDFGGF